MKYFRNIKDTIIFILGIASIIAMFMLTSCSTMEPINNYPGAIVTDKVPMRFNGRLIIIKYKKQLPKRKQLKNDKGVVSEIWVYKRLWISNFEYRNLKTGDTLR